MLCFPFLSIPHSTILTFYYGYMYDCGFNSYIPQQILQAYK